MKGLNRRLISVISLLALKWTLGEAEDKTAASDPHLTLGGDKIVSNFSGQVTSSENGAVLPPIKGHSNHFPDITSELNPIVQSILSDLDVIWDFVHNNRNNNNSVENKNNTREEEYKELQTILPQVYELVHSRQSLIADAAAADDTLDSLQILLKQLRLQLGVTNNNHSSFPDPIIHNPTREAHEKSEEKLIFTTLKSVIADHYYSRLLENDDDDTRSIPSPSHNSYYETYYYDKKPKINVTPTKYLYYQSDHSNKPIQKIVVVRDRVTTSPPFVPMVVHKNDRTTAKSAIIRIPTAALPLLPQKTLLHTSMPMIITRRKSSTTTTTRKPLPSSTTPDYYASYYPNIGEEESQMEADFDKTGIEQLANSIAHILYPWHEDLQEESNNNKPTGNEISSYDYLNEDGTLQSPSDMFFEDDYDLETTTTDKQESFGFVPIKLFGSSSSPHTTTVSSGTTEFFYAPTTSTPEDTTPKIPTIYVALKNKATTTTENSVLTYSDIDDAVTEAPVSPSTSESLVEESDPLLKMDSSSSSDINVSVSVTNADETTTTTTTAPAPFQVVQFIHTSASNPILQSPSTVVTGTRVGIANIVATLVGLPFSTKLVIALALVISVTSVVLGMVSLGPPILAIGILALMIPITILLLLGRNKRRSSTFKDSQWLLDKLLEVEAILGESIRKYE